MTLPDDDKALARALGGPADPPRRHDAAFVHAVLADVDARRSRRSPWALPAWAGVGAAAALALFFALQSSPPVDDWPLDDAATFALLDEEALEYEGAFDDESLDSLEELEDEELLALMAALDEALSL